VNWSRRDERGLAKWLVFGALVGSVVGYVVTVGLNLYFVSGPGAETIDSGKLYWLLVMVLGFPMSLLPPNPWVLVLNGALIGSILGVLRKLAAT
jgi:hypothetical protein